ncbi:uncharacterized protein [Drosophila takahashii]|uniref:uncharacterized protein isoform X1 n=1 Tax=Drosophila takahashii TaxID=29030 RepID=UPI0038994C38
MFAERCGARCPMALRGTMLRKHLATYTSLLNVEDMQIDRLANFMGHHKDVHKSIYRIPVSVAEIPEVSKMLMAALGNDDPEDESIPVPLTNNDFDDSGSNYSDNKSKSGSDDEFLQSFKNNEKKRSSFEKIQRKRWTAEEINALTIEFGEPAQISKLPSLKKCIEVINRNPHLKDRTPQQVKSWIDNQRKAEGRKTGSSLNKKKY